jgi:hypothetical protein
MTGRRCGGRVVGVSLVESSMNRLPVMGVGRVVLPLPSSLLGGGGVEPPAGVRGVGVWHTVGP